MESTGSTTSKSDKRENSIPKENFKYIPSIVEFGLSEDKKNKKKLQILFDKYLKPKQNDAKALDI
jgi:hypothetical protein